MKIYLPVSQQTLKPGKLLCIGKNYALHAAEMQSTVPEQPMVFLKPSTALIPDGGEVVLPRMSASIHHEVELVAVIGKGGKHISQEEALSHIEAYAVGLDMTARDLQAQAKEKGHPWSVAKGFDTFAPLGTLVAASTIADPQNLELRLTVNGETRQHGFTRDMMYPLAELIAFCSTIFTLEPGDLLFTGTPEGVGPVAAGDVLVATASGMPPLRVTVRDE